MNEIPTLLLDTNAFIYLINGDQTVANIIDKRIVASNFVIEIELLCWPLQSSNTKKAILSFLKEIQYFDYSHRIKEKTIDIKKRYKQKLGDAFIAATALEHGLIIVSADTSFMRIPELSTINFIPSI